MKTYVVSGTASDIGAATRARLERDGHTVVGVDLLDADVITDLATANERHAAAAAVTALAPDGIDGFVPCAGLAGLTGVDGRLLVSVNYFGAIDLLAALRAAFNPAAAVVLLSSNSVTCQPGWTTEVADACLAHEEERPGPRQPRSRRCRSTRQRRPHWPGGPAARVYGRTGSAPASGSTRSPRASSRHR